MDRRPADRSPSPSEDKRPATAVCPLSQPIPPSRCGRLVPSARSPPRSRPASSTFCPHNGELFPLDRIPKCHWTAGLQAGLFSLKPRATPPPPGGDPAQKPLSKALFAGLSTAAHCQKEGTKQARRATEAAIPKGFRPRSQAARDPYFGLPPPPPSAAGPVEGGGVRQSGDPFPRLIHPHGGRRGPFMFDHHPILRSPTPLPAPGPRGCAPAGDGEAQRGPPSARSPPRKLI